MKRVVAATVVALSVGLSSQALASTTPVNSLNITTDVVEAALKNPFGNYLNYHIIGACFWLHWSIFGPYVTSTMKVNEFLPDAVVSVYNGYGSDPWFYANKVVDPVTYQAGKAEERSINGYSLGGTSPDVGHGDNEYKFKEVDIIGDPALTVFFNNLPFAFIPSVATEFEPYYSSLSDAYLWRNPMTDDLTHPQDLIPGVRTEGSLIDQWGNIFPRIGFIDQPGDYKAAAVLALRAADIATNSDQGHVYHELYSGSCGNECTVWPSHENDFADVKYQEIYPDKTTSANKSFGVDGLAGTGPYGQGQYTEGHGNYVWVMWRHYRGCIQSSGQFIGSI